MGAASVVADNLRLSLNRHAQTLERISSGKRINSAKDDPSGLSMATKMSVSIRSAEAFEKNIQNAMSFLQVQDGVLEKMGQALERMTELKTLSDDVTKSSADVELYQTEYMALQEHLEALCMEEFNGIRLFASSSTPDHLFVENVAGNGSYQVSRPFCGDVTNLESISIKLEYEVKTFAAGSTNWQAAKNLAESNGGHLAIIDTQEKQNIIAKMLEAYPANQEFFIGASDENEEGKWFWLDGTNVVFENWANGEPSGASSTEDYATIATGGWGLIKRAEWNDVALDRDFRRIGYILDKSIDFEDIEASTLSSSLQNIAQARATNGAEQNQLQIATALNATSKQNREAVLSAIQDTDIAMASADLSKSKIFIEAGAALLAMQNMNSQSVLRLLQ